MQLVTDAISNPNNVAGRSYDMPIIWAPSSIHLRLL